MTSFQAPNSDNSPGGLGNTAPLNLNGVGNGNQQQGNYLSDLINESQSIPDPLNPPPAMKTLVYSPDVQVVIGTTTGKEYDVSSDLVRGTLIRKENSASTFFCELANHDQRYTKNGGMFSRMDRITVFMKRTNWYQVFSGYLDTVPFAQMWAGNVNLRATCTLKRLLYTYWNPNLSMSQAIFKNQMIFDPANRLDIQAGAMTDAGLGDMLGNLICWVGGWSPQNVHIQDFPPTFWNSMEGEFRKLQLQNDRTEEEFRTLLLGHDHTPGVGSAAGQKNLSTGPGLGPQVVGIPAYKQQVIAAVDARGMGPNINDIQNSYLAEQLSATGQGTREAAVAKAFQENASLGQAIQTQARTTDAAILAFACVTAESAWLMRANPAIPESLNYHYDAMSFDYDSIGLFQQRNQGWGTVMQRMNPYASAGMFLDELAKIPWQNMDPAEAIAQVQRNRDGAATYRTLIAAATQEVQAIRAGQGKYAPPAAITGVNLSSITAATAGQSIMGAATSGAGVPGVSQNIPAPAALPVAMPGRPQPDSQGAVLCAQFMMGRPYKVGGNSPEEGFDSAGLILYAFRSIGREVGVGLSQQAVSGIRVNGIAYARPGDVVQIDGGSHAILITSEGMGIQALPGVGVVQVPINFTPDQISGIYRYADWGGPGPAPFNPAAGPGMPVGTGSTGGGIVRTGNQGQEEPIARNLFSYLFTPQQFAPTIAEFFSGQKSFLDCQPLIQEVQAITRAGLRHFCSAPNGDFIAYYPDFFGVDGKPVTMKIEDIEMKDVRINLSDDAMTTHVYVSGDQTFGLGSGANTQPLGWIASAGVATVENATLFQRLKNIVPGKAEDLTGNAILQRYGVRPLQLEFNMIANHKLEFLVACQLFMQKWAEQYETSASFTFMPELFPGMRIQLGDKGIAVYVAEVTHNFDWEEGFSTSAKIMAPSSVNGANIVNTVMYGGVADATKNPVNSEVRFSGTY